MPLYCLTAWGEFKANDPLDIPYDRLDNLFRIEVVGALAAAKALLRAMTEKANVNTRTTLWPKSVFVLYLRV